MQMFRLTKYNPVKFISFSWVSYFSLPVILPELVVHEKLSTLYCRITDHPQFLTDPMFPLKKQKKNL